jgi:peptide/nickel transport system substrate-binding protein
MDDDQPDQSDSGWKRLQKLNINSKSISKRMRKVEGVTVRHARKFVFRRWSNIREVRRHIAIWVLMVGYIIGASALQLMWYQQSYRTVTAATDGTYAEAVLGPVNSLNPLFASTSAEQSASALMFSRIFNYDTTGHVNYDLATDMKINDSKTVYTIKVRSDVKWHDGIQLTANDIAFTVGLLKNKAVRSNISGWDDIGVKAQDDTTVVFTLPAVYAAFPHALTFPILPEHLLKNIEPASIRQSSFSTSPIGSGPFKLRFVQDIDAANGRKIIHLARNTDYYKGVPKLDRFQLHVYGTKDSIVKAISTAEVNGAVDLSVTDLSKINPTRNQIKREPIDSGVYALLNTTSPLLQDKAIRQALQVGTNTQAIRDSLAKDTPALYLPFIASQVTGDIPKAPGYDQVNAKKILDDAGWKLEGTTRKKNGVELKLNVVTTKDSDFEKVLEKLVGQWRDLGISITTNVVDQSDISQSILQHRNFDVLVYQLLLGADPDVYAYWHSSQIGELGRNVTNYSNPISDDALASGRSRVEPELRNAKYLTFARQWLSDIPAIGLYQSTLQYVSTDSVHAFNDKNVLVSPTDRYADVIYWSVGDRTVFTTQ